MKTFKLINTINGECTVVKTVKFNRLISAELYFLSVYPEYYFGGAVKQVDGTDFTCIPDLDYYKRLLKTDDIEVIKDYVFNECMEFLKNANGIEM